jgi:hypothetical protein
VVHRLGYKRPFVAIGVVNPSMCRQFAHNGRLHHFRPWRYVSKVTDCSPHSPHSALNDFHPLRAPKKHVAV